MFIDLRRVYENITPVIHTIKPHNLELDEYESYKPRVIAIGQNKDRSKKSKRTLLQNTIKRIQLRSKCHLLGVSSEDMLEDVPYLDSCDSKSWLDYATRGQILFNRLDKNNLVSYVIYFPEFENTKPRGNDVLFDEMPDNDKKIFLDEMNKHLQLSIDDLRNTNRVEARLFANIFYEQRKFAHLNSRLVLNKIAGGSH